MSSGQKLLSSRRGTLMMAAVFAVLALVCILFYTHRYSQSASGAGSPATVLLVKTTIPKGTTSEIILSGNYYKVGQVRSDQLVPGAISEPGKLIGVATKDLYPGQQLSANDFAAASASMATQLTGTQRAITLKLDQAPGMAGNIQAGSRVNVLAGLQVQNKAGQMEPIVKLIGQDILVLQAPDKPKKGGLGGSGSSTNASVVLRANNDTQAAAFAFASQNGSVWLVLRPQASKDVVKETITDIGSVLSGAATVMAGTP